MPQRSWERRDPVSRETPCGPLLKNFRSKSWNRGTAKGTSESRSSAASSATGKLNRHGVIDEQRRGQMVCFSRPDKKRPVVILTRDSALEFLAEVTVAPITSTIRD